MELDGVGNFASGSTFYVVTENALDTNRSKAYNCYGSFCYLLLFSPYVCLDRSKLRLLKSVEKPSFGKKLFILLTVCSIVIYLFIFISVIIYNYLSTSRFGFEVFGVDCTSSCPLLTINLFM